MRPSYLGLRSESGLLLRLDSLRFLAAVMVVVYHFRNQWTFASGPGWAMTGFGNMTFAVDLFFVISGIVISCAYEGRLEFGTFLRRRFARLAPLHYATFLFYLIAGGLAIWSGHAFWEADKFRPECVASQLLFLQAHGLCSGHSFNHVSWSIGAEMTVYLLFPLFLKLAGWHRALPALIALAWIVALGVVEPWLPGDEPWHKLTYGLGLVRAVPGFLAGMSLWAFRDKLAKLPFADAILMGTLILFGAGIVAEAGREMMLALTYALAAVAFAADMTRRERRLAAMIAPLAALTYSIYMLHPLVRTVGFPIFTGAGLGGNAAIALCGLLVLPLAYLSYFWFENPTRRWLSAAAWRSVQPTA